jgi:hypothetical protein
MEAVPVEINWHPALSIYASEPFLKAVGDEYGWLGGYDSGNMCCILPYTIIRKPGFRMVRFRVETIPVGGEITIIEEKSFLNSVIEYFRSIKADMIIPATTNTIFRTYPEGAIAAPYGTYIVDLTQEEEVLWDNLHSKNRNVIRNAKKKGVEIRSGLEYLEAVYTVVRNTLKRSGLGFMSYEAFRRYILSFGSQVKIYIADFHGTIQGCAVIPFSFHSAYYVYGGSTEQPLTGAMNLLQWEAIREFKALSVQRYDFVGGRINPEKGSKQEGLTMFKERFGGQLIQGFMWKYPLKPMKFAVYALAVRFIRGGDIVDAEHHKLSSIQNDV